MPPLCAALLALLRQLRATTDRTKTREGLMDVSRPRRFSDTSSGDSIFAIQWPLTIPSVIFCAHAVLLSFAG